MKISYSWLKELLTLPLNTSPTEVAAQLTMIGLEAEGIEPSEQVKGSLAGVVVGHVLTVAQHPNADRLKVCTVDIGTGAHSQIVCGAPNVAQGQYVLVALPGITIYPAGKEPLTLKNATIRGVASEGMICAEDELGLGQSHEGILILPHEYLPGTPAAGALGLTQDWILELGITPNRGDALSHYGVARDLGAFLSLKSALPKLATLPNPLGQSKFSVNIKDPALCLRYSGLVIEGVSVGESPVWLRQRLLSVGQRPINSIVDIVNYVMLELGQPMHAFDLDLIEDHGLEIKTLAAPEPFQALDNKTYTLTPTDLVIADSAHTLCIAGVMGGLNSAVSAVTKRIFLESACFNAASVQATSRQLGIYSESSYRFARGTDPHGTLPALHRALYLIQEIAGGEATELIDQVEGTIDPIEVPFSYSKAVQLIGKAIPRTEIDSILERLEIGITSTSDSDKVVLSVPRYRVDVTRQQDIVEDVLRIYGYNEVPEATRLAASVTFGPASAPQALRERVAEYLSANGFYEIVTNSLVPQIGASAAAVQLANPLSETLAVMRESLLESGLAVLAHNANRKMRSQRLYEFGKVYSWPAEAPEPVEHFRLALFLYENEKAQSWRNKVEQVDFYTLKGIVEQLCTRLSIHFAVRPWATDAEMEFGLELVWGHEVIARVGAVKQELSNRYDLDDTVYYAELNWPIVEQAAVQNKIEFRELPKFPAVRRDLSLVVPSGVIFDLIQKTILEANPTLIKEVNVFDVYSKANTPTSYGIALVIQDSNKTLTDESIEKLIGRVLSKLEMIDVKLKT